MYLLIDLERTIALGRTFYWRANRQGYTTLTFEAGKYSEQEADQIIENDYDNRTVKVSEKVVEGILNLK